MPRTTPLHDIHVALGASFTDFAGWTMPLRYASETSEHHAVRRSAGLFDLSHMGQIEVTGPGAAAALDYGLVGLMSAMGPGRARYTMLCDHDGGILDDVVAYRLADDRFLVVANASNTAVVFGVLRERLRSFDAQVLDASDRWALIAVQGPMSAPVIEVATGADPSPIRYYAIEQRQIAAAQVLLARTGYTGEDGFEIYCSPRDAALIWSVLRAAGQRFDLVPAGLACRDTLRLEAAMPLYGHELSRRLSPFDAGLGRIVAFGKPGGFIGEQALRQRSGSAPLRTLVGLATRGRRVPRSGHAVLDPATGEPVGEVTSGGHSPTLGFPIALAYVSPRHAAIGSDLVVDIRGRHEGAQVVSLPFHRRPNPSAF